MTKKLKLPTLLIISDNPSIGQWFKKNLSGRFYFIEAPDRRTALETVRTVSIDYIVLDSLLEEIDPLELSSELRQMSFAVPIFLITGRLKKSFRSAANRAGVTDFLNDQLSVEEIEARTAVVCKSAATRNKTADLSRQIKPAAETSESDFLKNRVLSDKPIAGFKKKKDR